MFDYIAATETLIEVKTDGLKWPGGGEATPSDSPFCGWDNELCPDNTREYNSVPSGSWKLSLKGTVSVPSGARISSLTQGPPMPSCKPFMLFSTVTR